MLLLFSGRFVGSAYPVAKRFCPWLRKLNAATQQATNNYSDDGIVTRLLDSNTGKIAIVAAGVGRGGDHRCR